MKYEGKIVSHGRVTGTIAFCKKITFQIAIDELNLGAENISTRQSLIAHGQFEENI